MITAIEYTAPNGETLRADKNVVERNAWHLSSIDGNGADMSVIGNASYGIAGTSFNGVSVGARDMSVILYADGYNTDGVQDMLTGISRLVNAGAQDIGQVKLTNSAGDSFIAPARLTSVDVSEYRRRTAQVKVVFSCPFFFFDDELLRTVPLYALTGGKEWALVRPYRFSEVEGGTGVRNITCVNNGDVPAPIVLKIHGTGVSRVIVRNITTGATFTVGGNGMSVTGIEVSTDVNNVYARLLDGSDASEYVSMLYNLTDFNLQHGANAIQVDITATSITQAETCLEYRGRWSTCL